MKFALNGALTVGTLDGANIEMRDEVKPENFFLLGLTAQQVADLKHTGYNPRQYVAEDAELQEAIELIASGILSPSEPDLFKPLVESLLNHDTFLLLPDYRSYIQCQEKVSQAYLDQENWTKMSILNVARMGKFSSDRSIREYAQHIWKIQPVHVTFKSR